MKKMKFLFIFIFGVFNLSFAEESITITTYYPSPYGSYRELRSQRMAVGDSLIDNTSFCWEGSCTRQVDDKYDLITEGSVRIGRPVRTGGEVFPLWPRARLHVYLSDDGGDQVESQFTQAVSGHDAVNATTGYLAFRDDRPGINAAFGVFGVGGCTSCSGVAGQGNRYGGIFTGTRNHVDPIYGVQPNNIATLGIDGEVTVDGTSISGAGITAIGENYGGTFTCTAVGCYSAQFNKKIKILGSIETQGSISATGDMYSGGSKVLTESTYPSDIRLKKDIVPIDNALQKVLDVRGVYFYWKDKSKNGGKRDIGVIAQEVEKVLPDLVKENPDGYKTVSYERLSSVIIQAIRELKTEKDKEIVSLKREIAQIEKTLLGLEKNK
ncbi:MAG: tail fiber domain-containing protein [Candidatus Omnitrophota bacterium]|jgi:hypothetical protein